MLDLVERHIGIPAVSKFRTLDHQVKVEAHDNTDAIMVKLTATDWVPATITKGWQEKC